MVHFLNVSNQIWQQFRERAQRQRRVTPDKALGLEFEPLTLTTRDGVALDAWYIPAQGAVGAVVAHHFMGGQKEVLLPWIRVLHALGWAVVCFDARGHGRSRGALDAAAAARRLDVEAAWAEARRRGHAGIVGLGQSQGAAVLALAAAPKPDLCGFIFDSGPAAEILSPTWGFTSTLTKHRSVRLLLTARLVSRAAPARYTPALLHALWQTRSLPLLWLHGDRDAVTPRWSVAAWYALLRQQSGPWHAVRIAEAEHVRCLQEGGQMVEDAVANLLQRAAQRATL